MLGSKIENSEAIPDNFSYRIPNKGYQKFVYNKKRKRYETQKEDINKENYFQLVSLKPVFLNNQDKRSEKQSKYRYITVKARTLELVGLKNKPQHEGFIIVPGLYDKNIIGRTCVSFTLKSRSGYYLSPYKRKLLFQKLEENDRFKKESTFCIEKTNGNYFRF